METLTKRSTSKNVEKQTRQKSSELVKRKIVEDSPFTIITVDGKSFGVMGEYRVTENKNKVEEVEEELKNITWNRIIQVMMILEEIRTKDKEFDNKVKEVINNK